MTSTITIGSTGDRGRGVIARRPLAPGERVFAVTGRATRERTRYTIQVARDRHIEPDTPGRFLNHSCEPNAGIRAGADGGIEVVAMVPVPEGGEITVDYAMFEEVVGPSSEGSCLCGTSTCRGRITGFRDTSDAWRRRYTHWTAPYLADVR